MYKLSILIQILSFILALAGGAYMFNNMFDWKGIALAYAFSFACGAAGARFAAVVRKGI